jgi:hypothetical protein
MNNQGNKEGCEDMQCDEEAEGIKKAKAAYDGILTQKVILEAEDLQKRMGSIPVVEMFQPFTK